MFALPPRQLGLFTVALTVALLGAATPAHAEWNRLQSKLANAPTIAEACAENRSDLGIWYNSNQGPKYFDDYATGTVQGKTKKYCSTALYHWHSDQGLPPDLSGIDSPVYEHAYTDEQCQAQYGTASIPANENGWFPESYDAGACSLAYVPGSGFCSTVTNECTGDFTATSTGNTNTPGSSGGSPSPDPPDYLTETDDPDSCPAGHVAYGGQAYCVDQSAIDDGSVSVPDPGDSGGDSGSGGGIDWGEDSAGSPAPGTSTDSDGNPLGMGGGDPDGDGEGDSTAGDIVGAINSLKNTVRNGLDGVLDGVRDYFDGFVEGLAEGPSQAALDAEFGTQEDAGNAMQAGIDGVKDQLMQHIDGSDSAFTDAYDTMGSYFGTYFPSIPEPSCTPLTFAPGKAYSFTIQCDVFTLIREALAWILYAFTAYVIISTMFSARPH